MYDFLNLLQNGKRSLLVGEGNFSFSVSLLTKNIESSGNCANPTALITSTCFQKYRDLSEVAKKNARLINKLGAEVWFGVDATKLHHHERLLESKFDFILFNFPHIGGKMKVHLNRLLLKNFFMSASPLLTSGGRVLVTLCQGQSGTPFDTKLRKYGDSWQIIEMASYGDLILNGAYPFDVSNWPLYNCNGYRSLEKSFHLNGALTFAFIKSELSIDFKAKPVIPSDSNQSHCCQYVESRRKCLLGHTFEELDLFIPLLRNNIETSKACDLPQSICLCQTEENQRTANWWELINVEANDFKIVCIVLCYPCWVKGSQPVRKVILFSNVSVEYVQPILNFLDRRCTRRAVNDFSREIHYDLPTNLLEVATVFTNSNQRKKISLALYIEEFLQLGVNFPIPGVSFPFDHHLEKLSLHPPAYRHHLSFWIPELYSHKRFACTLRLIAGEVITHFELIDEYTCPVQKRKSLCYLIVYRSLGEALSSEKAFYLQTKIIGPFLEENLRVIVK